MPDGRTEARTTPRVSIDLTVELEPELAEVAREVQRRDPEFFSMVVRYGLLRRSVHREIAVLQEKLFEEVQEFLYDQPRAIPQADGEP